MNRGWVQSMQNVDIIFIKTEARVKEAKTFRQEKELLHFYGFLWYTAKKL